MNKVCISPVYTGVLTVLSAAFFTIFTGCQNFLSGTKLKEELEEQIAYANAKELDILLDSDDVYGKFVSDLKIKCKLGYSAEFQYKVNQSYVLNKMILSCKESEDCSDDYVKFETVSYDEDKGIYKIKMTLLKEVNDAVVRPECFLIPAIKSVYPLEDTTVSQYTNISIYFNKEINLENFKNKYTNKIYNIFIAKGSTKISDCFGEPYLIDEGKTLVIPALKEKSILKENEESADINVTIYFYDKQGYFTDAKEGENVSFNEDKYSFGYTINSEADDTGPYTVDTKFAKTKELLESDGTELIKDSFYNYAGKTANADTNIPLNHIKDSLYMYAAFEDTYSEISKFVISEQLVRYVNQNDYSAVAVDLTESHIINTEISSSSLKKEFNKESGVYTYIYDDQFTLKSTADGVIRVTVSAYDNAGNKGEEITLDVIKDTSMPEEILIRQLDSEICTGDAEKRFVISFGKSEKIYMTDCAGTVFSKGYFDGTFSSNFSRNFNNISFTEVLYSSDCVNWSKVDDVHNCLAGYATTKNYSPAATCSFTIKTGNACYIKVIARDDIGNEKEYLTTIQAPSEIIEYYEADGKYYFRFKESPLNTYSMFYEKILDDGTSEGLIPCILGGNYKGTTYYYLTTNNYTVVTEPDINTLKEEKGKYNFYVQSCYGKQDGSNDYNYISVTNWDTYKTNPNLASKTKVFYREYDDTSVYSDETPAYALTGSLSKAFTLDYTKAQQSISDSSVPSEEQFSVTATADGVNSGTYTITVTYSEDFTKDADLDYYIRYNIKDNSKYYYSEGNSFTVPSMNTYKICIVARNSKNVTKESAAKEIECAYDNIIPDLGNIYGQNYSNKVQISTITDNEGGTGIKNIKAWILDAAGLSYEQVLQNDECKISKGIRLDSNGNKVECLDIYTNRKENFYVYIYAEDNNGNYAVNSLYIKRNGYKDYTPEISLDNWINASDTEVWTLKYEMEKDVFKAGGGIFSVLDEVNLVWIKTYIVDEQETVFSGGWNIDSKYEKYFIRVETSRDAVFNNAVYSYYDSNTDCNLKDVVQGLLGVTVYCDNKTFTHTLCCNENLGNNIGQWEAQGAEYGLHTGTTTYSYAAPEADLPDNCYYTIVTHFADGTQCMTTPVLFTK